MSGLDALVAQRELQLDRLLEAHKALVRRFEQADAERTARAAALVDAEALLSLAEQEIGLREVHARGLRRTLDQRILEARELERRADEALAKAAALAHLPGVVQALEQAVADAEGRIEPLRHDLAQAHRRIEQLRDDLAQAHGTIDRITGSRSWKLTQPLRRLNALFRRGADPA